MLPENIFDDIILPEFKKDASGLHAINFNLNIHFPESSEITSPSHNIDINDKKGYFIVSLDKSRDIPNRDLMINIETDFTQPKIWYGEDSKNKLSFSCVIPGEEFFKDINDRKAGKVVFVLDKSGSMYGDPLDRAEKALIKCINNLSEDDLFGIITFASYPNILTPKLLNATTENKNLAIKLLKNDDTDGGTEILSALMKGVELLEGSGDIFLITDGEVWESEKVINFDYQDVKIHCLGIGSSSQDRFMSNLTYKTGGTYVFLSLNEEIEEKAIKLFNNIVSPLAVNISAAIKGEGSIEPKPARTVYKFFKISGYFDEVDNDTSIEVSWDNDEKKTYSVAKFGEKTNGESLRLIRGSKLISLTENMVHISKKHKRRRFKQNLVKLREEFGISNSQMSLVAVVKRKGDVAGEIPETMVVPVGMPDGTKYDAYFSDSKKCTALSLSNIEENYNDTPLFLRMRKEISPKKEKSSFLGNVKKRFLNLKSNKLKKNLSDYILKIDTYCIINDDGSVDGNTTEEKGLKAFIILLGLKLAYYFDDKVNYETEIIKLENFLYNILLYDLHPELKEILDNLDENISSDDVQNELINNILILIEDYILLPINNDKLNSKEIVNMLEDVLI